MSIPANIYRTVATVALLGTLVGCNRPHMEISEAPQPVSVASADQRGFDPLELRRDRDIIPALYPKVGDITGKQVIVEKEQIEPSSDSLGTSIPPAAPITDSLNSQAYRVQIFTGLVNGEARQVARVAEEIFDQPVFVDYEVPNFKVRVGNWPDRASAEKYQEKARAVGYTNAWVVMVGVNVREVAPLYDSRTQPKIPPTGNPQDTVTGNVEGTGVKH